MPRANIFIRKDDLDKWKTLENKSQFIHNALNTIESKVIKTPQDAQKAVTKLKKPPITYSRPINSA